MLRLQGKATLARDMEHRWPLFNSSAPHHTGGNRGKQVKEVQGGAGRASFPGRQPPQSHRAPRSEGACLVQDPAVAIVKFLIILRTRGPAFFFCVGPGTS